jgi:parallel beta-helix repeat protein
MNRAVFALFAILFLLSIPSITGLIHVVKAESAPIYINADGSISPSTAPIYTADNITYTLTGNIAAGAGADGIVIERDNIVLDGAGYTLTGSGYGGTMLTSMGNVTINRMMITNFTVGIYLNSSSKCTFSGNNVANNGYGIWLDSSSGNILSGNNATADSVSGIVFNSSDNNNILSGNNVTNNPYGFDIESSDNNTLSGNNVANGVHGIYLYSCSNCTLSGNNITANNEDGIWLNSSFSNTIYHNNFINNTSQVISSNSTNVWDNGSSGNYWSDYVTKYPSAVQADSSGIWNTPYVIDTNNTDYYPLMVPYGVIIEGAPIYINADGSISPLTAPIYTADNVTYALTGNITANADGIVVERSNIVLKGAGYTLTGSGSKNGTTLTNISNVTINNMMITNFTNGIELESSSNNVLSGNNVAADSISGIVLGSSNNNTLSGNSVASNIYGIYLSISSNNNTLSGNSVASNIYGIYLSISSNNTLSGNSVASNIYGMWFASSSSNFIFNNNFVNNTYQVSTDGLANVWDNGSSGNYWSDYVTKYPSAVQVDSSGVWNTPYVIDANNTDYYPLMVLYGVIPEFPSIQTTMFFMLLTLLTVIIYKKKGVKRKA